jgi:hypothetical protein
MKGRRRAQRRAKARISWFAPKIKEWGPVLEAFGPLPLEGQQRLAIRLFGARYLNTGAAALSDRDKRDLQKVARYARKHLANVDNVRVQSVVAALNRLDHSTAQILKPKESHTLLLEGLFDAYVATRLEYPDSGPPGGFNEALRRFLDAVFDLIGLESMYSVDCLINEDEARGVWNRWIRPKHRTFLDVMLNLIMSMYSDSLINEDEARSLIRSMYSDDQDEVRAGFAHIDTIFHR